MAEPTRRHIIHLDMDAFYASVEVLDNPQLTGLPVVVGGNSNRGVVSAASYAARKFGIHSAMPIITAKKLCPQAVFLPVRMARYQEISGRIMAIFHRFTPLVEPISLDEAFLDVTASKALKGDAVTIAAEIKKMVREETGLTVSAGVAATKLLAKIASDQNKPDGLTVVPAGREQEFLAPLPIARLWGVGPATRDSLAMFSVKTIGDLCKLPLTTLVAKFGNKQGEHLHLVCQGIDPRPVIAEHEIKSIGNEETFATDLLDRKLIKQELLTLCTKVGKRVRANGVQGKTVTIKVKYRDFQQVSRANTLDYAIDDDRSLYETGCDLLNKTEAGRRPIRLLGITVSNLHPGGASGQLSLFAPDPTRQKRRALYKAIDTISDRYGNQTVIPAMLLLDEQG
ncbi:MAG: DNA polymerase IV [Desulfobulbaceae bacterium]|nr:DNA polymerase IV [Desulfobulbaceae bacterium]HIJ78698.1 DNA polymerase IV [Deltaproteobacteria bacterium]